MSDMQDIQMQDRPAEGQSAATDSRPSLTVESQVRASRGKRKPVLLYLLSALVILSGISFALVRLHVLSASKFSMSRTNDTPRLFPVCHQCSYSNYSYKGGKWGFIDSQGNLAISFQFDNAGEFSEGLAAVETGDKWGYIDERGQFVIKPQFDNIPGWDVAPVDPFSEGLALVRIGDKDGYIDKAGQYVINPQFDVAGDFADGLAEVDLGKKWGYIDKQGKYAINLQFDFAQPFHEGLAAVNIGKKESWDNHGVEVTGKWGFIDRNGKYVINPQFDGAYYFSNGLAAVQIGGKWGFIDKNGKYVINPQFDDTFSFDSMGVALVKVGDEWGYIGKDGHYLINPQFDNAGEFSEDLAAVEIGGKWGYINRSGQIVIAPQFTVDSELQPGAFHRSIAPIAPYTYVNTKGESVWPNPKKLAADNAQMFAVLEADAPQPKPGEAPIDGTFSGCAVTHATNAICFSARHGDLAAYAEAIFQDGKAAALAANLQFDALILADEDDKPEFVMLPTAEGWKSAPGMPPPGGGSPDATSIAPPGGEQVGVAPGDGPANGEASAPIYSDDKIEIESVNKKPYYDGCILSARIRNKTGMTLNAVIIDLDTMDSSGAITGNPAIVVYDIPPYGVAVKDMDGALNSTPADVKVGHVTYQ